MAFLRILRMKKIVFYVTSVWKWRHPAYTQYSLGKDLWLGDPFLFDTEYTRKILQFLTKVTLKIFVNILRLRIITFEVYWVYAKCIQFYIEYAHNNFFFILSINVEKFYIYHDKTFKHRCCSVFVIWILYKFLVKWTSMSLGISCQCDTCQKIVMYAVDYLHHVQFSFAKNFFDLNKLLQQSELRVKVHWHEISGDMDFLHFLL